MHIKSTASILATILCLHTPAFTANFNIDNPAERIKNPADKIYNPASDIKNPASNIYNPANHMDSQSPIYPQKQVVPDTVYAPVAKKHLLKSKPSIPSKSYDFKTVKQYIFAIKKAFNKDNYVKLISLAEDALMRIDEGTLKASSKTKLMLNKYKKFGYGLLEETYE